MGMIEIELKKWLEGAEGRMELQIDLSIQAGEFVDLTGPSGVGKSSTLRMLAGLLKPDNGKILMQGKPWYDKPNKIYLPPQKRSLGFLYQDYALFPHLNVEQNLLFALEKKKNQAKNIEE